LQLHKVLAQEEISYSYSEAFSVADGLDHTVISDLITDQNDLLWIAVNGTLQLFDGDQFIDMGHLVHPSITSGMFGYEKGKEVFLLKQHILYKFTPSAYTASDAPSLVLPSYGREEQDPSIIYEDVLFLYVWHPNDSLYQVNKTSLQIDYRFPFPHSPNFYRWSSIYVSQEPVKTIHYLDSNYQWCQYDLSTLSLTIDQRCPNAWRAALAAGDTMVVLQSKAVEIYSKAYKHTVPLPELARDYNGDRFLISGRDSVYVFGKNAIHILNLRTLTWVNKIVRNTGPPLQEIKVRRMTVDKSGHLYFSTFYSGLVKLYPSRSGFEYMGIQGEKKYFIKCIRASEKNNLVLAGTLMDGLMVFDTNGVLQHHIQRNQKKEPITLVSAIIKLSESRFLLFADKTFEITFHDGQYILRELTDPNKIRLTFYDSALEDSVHQRYFLFNHRQILEYHSSPNSVIREIPQPRNSSCVSATISGNQYILSRLNELIFYDQLMVPRTLKFNVPDFGYSRCLAPYSSSQFLVGTDLGLFLLDTLNPDAAHIPIFNQRVYALLPGDKNKEFWFTTDAGLYHLDANLQYTRYAIESGLQENEFNTNSCYKSESGKLYFGGINGITAFYPSKVYSENDQPVPYISMLNINGEVRERYLTPGLSPEYDLDFNENVIRIRLLGRGQRSPKNYSFQYKIKELHKDWIDLGHNMEIQFQLAPGHYTLYYHIGDKFETDAPPGEAIRFHIHPPVYARWWFRALLLLAVAIVVYSVVNARRKRQALNLQYERELEKNLYKDRLRISRELHDNIGAQMATVKRHINFLIDHREKLNSNQFTDKMKDLEGISSQINQELRDTIWAVQNEQIDVSGFISRLKNYIFQVTGPDSPLRVNYTQDCEQQIILGPFTALNLHRICQESINNILKHARASEIHISFLCTADDLNITIADNGVGFDPGTVQAGYGLENIRRRAEQIHARVRFVPQQPQGSALEITMPLHTLGRDKTKTHA
jgi:signal transduction histidine kinase/ligand-binding sensor domain-containing protein